MVNSCHIVLVKINTRFLLERTNLDSISKLWNFLFSCKRLVVNPLHSNFVCNTLFLSFLHFVFFVFPLGEKVSCFANKVRNSLKYGVKKGMYWGVFALLEGLMI